MDKVELTIHSKKVFAHRLAYTLAHGAIPPGLFVCHTCDTPPCVWPDHLFLGTQKENMQDMVRKGRYGSRVLPSGENHHNSRLTWAQVDAIRAAYEPGVVTTRQLGQKYGVSNTTIKNILTGKVWKRADK